MSTEKTYDIIIIGAGINGAAIARDAAGRGLSVCLLEKGELGRATSSASTKLIHGGLRYLEHYDFKMVWESLREREILLKAAPFLNKPMQFILPFEEGGRPAWLLRLGLFLYDMMAFPTKLPFSKSISFLKAPFKDILKTQFYKGFLYSDVWTDDYQLVLLNIKDAVNKGANLSENTELFDAKREGHHWHLNIKKEGKKSKLKSKILINATGPWVDEVDLKFSYLPKDPIKKHALRLVKGSHIIVPKLYDHSFAYILQNNDGRVIFTIPYHNNTSLIGTTEVEVTQAGYHLKASLDEKKYLIEAVNNHFQKQLKLKDIIDSYAGIRPLYEHNHAEKSSLSRESHLVLDEGPIDDMAPLLTVYGGKLTTHRLLAEKAMDALGFGAKSWTRHQIF